MRSDSPFTSGKVIKHTTHQFGFTLRKNKKREEREREMYIITCGVLHYTPIDLDPTQNLLLLKKSIMQFSSKYFLFEPCLLPATLGSVLRLWTRSPTHLTSTGRTIMTVKKIWLLQMTKKGTGVFRDLWSMSKNEHDERDWAMNHFSTP